MDISLLLTSFAGQTRPGNGQGNSAEAAGATGGFADALAALQGPPASGVFPGALASLSTAHSADPASREAMMRALSDEAGMLGEGSFPGGSSFGEDSFIEHPLAEIAQRLALIAAAGESAPNENVAALDEGQPSLPGQLAAVAGEPARTTLDARHGADAASPLGLASRSASALAQLGGEPSLAANPGAETTTPGQRQNAMADALPNALARADVAPALSDSRLDGRSEGRPDGLAGLNNIAPGNSMAAASAPSPQGSLTAPLSSPAWPTQLGQQLVMLGQRGGEHRVELHLNPAELGPLTVSLKMSEQGAQAQFLSAHAQVRQALEQAIPQLREALAEQGISLGQTSVGEHRQQGQGDQRAFTGQPGSSGQAAGAEENDPAGTATVASAPFQEGDRVDLYA